MLGVFLTHDPAVFGVTRRRASDMSSFRTGLSAAVAMDVDDDSHDLSWLHDLPTSDVGAIKVLANSAPGRVRGSTTPRAHARARVIEQARRPTPTPG